MHGSFLLWGWLVIDLKKTNQIVIDMYLERKKEFPTFVPHGLTALKINTLSDASIVQCCVKLFD